MKTAELEINTEIAKKLFGWREIQAPQYDAKGPLPEQGKVLVSPEFNEDEYRGWPNFGVIPYTFFIGTRFTQNLDSAMAVVRRITFIGYRFELSTESQKKGTVYKVRFIKGRGSKKHEVFGRNECPAMAICEAAAFGEWK